MTLVDDCKPIFEGARVLLADLGFRRYDVVMRVVDWSGDTVGDGTKTVTDYPLEIQGRRVKVRRVKQEDVVASGGTWEDIDYRVGPFTPEFTGAFPPFVTGGLMVEDFNPPEAPNPRSVYYKLTGPGIEAGAWFKKISQEVDRNWSLYFTVRKTSTRDP
ncbi:hypothetical protein [Polyangium spumosum]|uniref:Uncharacterized protein n=1 Tax=Polyangium spumosum TaxID=889282 RepID=A0A6N7Q6A1_9BACT|nr:hypothetical protein [Polyangium spumosum]MRG98215.1 hypothetical protein [Polyangium spumosum]